MMKSLTLLLLLVPSVVTANVYKCEIDGVMTFSQIPCSDDAEVTHYATEELKPLQLQQGELVVTENAAATMDRLRGALRKRDIQQQINRLEAEKLRKIAERNAKINQLRNAKLAAENNLAGAVQQDSISGEMTAVVTQYDTDVRMIESEINRLNDEARQL
ncbi:hypothetical protein WG68_18130 [Arsukibacterium ikkense]|uniref:DUF4124 domain-containing protein n=1 Tax=Arsukibacterium ikkense TaxID=336831 RepID=A0A0M2V058_9GAMM|nr:DUF4124 domain-containing protein [Arsukibacterium ikkense]KKO43956.1 hypothetical protein WG68_18130 [Arsukibacterium ikkense]